MMQRPITSTFFLRRTAILLARPVGPVQTDIHVYKDRMINRTESVMAQGTWHRPEYMSARFQNAGPMTQHKLRAIPRDLGQIPREYIIRLLYFNQPCTVDTLWTLSKADESCPFDSKKHMKQVLKIATLQDWVVYEKNQTNNLYFASVHPSKAKEAQDLLYVQRKQTEMAEREAAKKADAARQESKTKRNEGLDMAIQQLQHQLITCVVKLQEHDPALIEKLACVTPNGGIDFHWYNEERKKNMLAASSSSSNAEEGEN
jgi:hypothetical protein